MPRDGLRARHHPTSSSCHEQSAFGESDHHDVRVCAHRSRNGRRGGRRRSLRGARAVVGIQVRSHARGGRVGHDRHRRAIFVRSSRTWSCITASIAPGAGASIHAISAEIASSLRYANEKPSVDSAVRVMALLIRTHSGSSPSFHRVRNRARSATAGSSNEYLRSKRLGRSRIAVSKRAGSFVVATVSSPCWTRIRPSREEDDRLRSSMSESRSSSTSKHGACSRARWNTARMLSWSVRLRDLKLFTYKQGTLRALTIALIACCTFYDD